MKRLFISMPIGFDKTIGPELFKRHGTNTDLQIDYWRERSYYNESLLDECDVVVFVHPYNKFNYLLSDLPNGMRSEFARAVGLHKQIATAYRNSDGILNFYNCSIKEMLDGTAVKGISGSSSSFMSTIVRAKILIDCSIEFKKVKKFII
jgi:hypothetical protein